MAHYYEVYDAYTGEVIKHVPVIPGAHHACFDEARRLRNRLNNEQGSSCIRFQYREIGNPRFKA